MNKLVDAYMDTMHTDGFVGPDPLELEIDVLRGRIAMLEDGLQLLKEQVVQMSVNALTMAKVVKELREQSTNPQQSAIILPDRFN